MASPYGVPQLDCGAALFGNGAPGTLPQKNKSGFLFLVPICSEALASGQGKQLLIDRVGFLGEATPGTGIGKTGWSS